MTLAEELGRAAECALSGTDAFVAAFSRNDVPAPDALSFSALRYYNESVSAMDELWVNVFGTAGAAEKTASARAWLEAQFERSLFGRVEAMLRMLHECAAVAASTTVPLTARYEGPVLCMRAVRSAASASSSTAAPACGLRARAYIHALLPIQHENNSGIVASQLGVYGPTLRPSQAHAVGPCMACTPPFTRHRAAGPEPSPFTLVAVRDQVRFLLSPTFHRPSSSGHPPNLWAQLLSNNGNCIYPATATKDCISSTR